MVEEDNDEVEDDKEHGAAVEVEVEGNFSEDADAAKEDAAKEDAAKEDAAKEDAANDDISAADPFSSASPPPHELARGLFVVRREEAPSASASLFRALIAAGWV